MLRLDFRFGGLCDEGFAMRAKFLAHILYDGLFQRPVGQSGERLRQRGPIPVTREIIAARDTPQFDE